MDCKYSLSAFVILCSVFAFCFTVSADDEKLRDIQGAAAIISNDIQTARDKAIEDAKVKAIEKVVGTYVDAQNIVVDEQYFDGYIRKTSLGYVKDYVVTEEWSEKDIYYVKISATVLEADLKGDKFKNAMLEELASSEGIVVTVPEWIEDEKSSEPAIQNNLNKCLLQNGFKVLDEEMLKNIMQGKEGKCLSEGDTECAKAISLRFLSENIVTGEARTKFSQLNGKIISHRAYVSLRAVESDTGKIFAAIGKLCVKGFASYQGDKKENGYHAGENALSNAADVICGTVKPADAPLCSDFQDEDLPWQLSKKIIQLKRTITIDVSGFQSESEAEKFKELIKLFRWVGNVVIEKYSSERTVFSVPYSQKTFFLVHDIETKGTDFAVTEWSRNTISAKKIR